MCLLTASGVSATTDSALDTMLDPKIKLGTSTPKADPSGDYAWDVFHKADALRPGAFATLSTKARQLTGGPRTRAPRPDEAAYLPGAVATLPSLGRLTGRGNTANVEVVTWLGVSPAFQSATGRVSISPAAPTV